MFPDIIICNKLFACNTSSFSLSSLASLNSLTGHPFCVGGEIPDRIMDIHIQCSIRYHGRRRSPIYFGLFLELNPLLGLSHIRTTACHPEANGLVERFHRQLKSANIATSSKLNWVGRLPIILLPIKSTMKEDVGCCPTELVQGTTLRLPGEMISNSKDHAL
nr:pro Pol polyprotein [Hymenolepis microstoma]